MILVDYRKGSKELIEPLQERGLPVVNGGELPTDVVFEGKGVGGAPLLVGIEHKKVEDLMKSLRDNRLNAQAFKMREGGIQIRLLFIVGSQRFDKQGRMVKRTGRNSFSTIPGIGHAEILKRLYTLQFCEGLTWEWFEYATGAHRAIEMLYRSLTDKNLDEHTSHLAPYEPARIIPISGQRRTLCTFPGVAREWSKAAIDKAHTVKAAVNHDARWWAELQAGGRRFGQSAADKVTAFLNSEDTL